MKKKLSLLMVALMAVAAFAGLRRGAEKNVTYALAEGDTFTSGQTVDVKDGETTVATITYGESGGADFSAAVAQSSIEGFTASTGGNGTNGNKPQGTWYTITPKVDATIDVAVALNADKAFYIEEDGVALTDYNGITVTKKYYGTYRFAAKANKAYKVYCAGSKLGFYGFKMTWTAEEQGGGEPAAQEVTMQYSGSTTTNMTGENDAALVGLDATEWSVVGAKGSSNNLPGLNKDGTIRLYGHPDGGNTVTVSSLNNATINSITLNLKASNNNIYVQVGDNTITETDGKYTINSSSFVLGNANASTTQVHINSVKINYVPGEAPAVEKPTFSLAEGTYAGAQKVEIACATEGATIRYTTDGTDPTAESTEYTAAIDIAATTTVKAIAIKGDDKSKVAAATYTIIEKIDGGTAAAPLTIAQAKTLIDTKDADVLSHADNKVYVKGKISQVDKFNESYGSIQYWISEDGTTTDQFEVYSGLGLNGAKFTSIDDIVVGADVVIVGNIKKYTPKEGDPIYEFDYNNEQVSYVGPAKDVEIAAADIIDGDITAACEAAAKGYTVGKLTITLAEGNYTVTKSLVAGGNITINGNGAIIDASALGANMIQWIAKATEDTKWTNADVAISGVTVKGLKKALFYSNSKYYYGDVTVDKCVVELAADATTFDYTKGSTAVNFTVTNSTFYAPAATTKSFYSSQAGQKTTEYNDEAVQTFTFTNNTMYNLAKGKNFFTHRQNNQKWLAYNVKNNIFVNCGKSGQVIKGMNGGGSSTNPVWDIDGNVFNFDGADTSAAESTGDEAEPVKNSIAGVIAFTDAANGDFNATLGTELAPATEKTVVGDPRWTVTNVQIPSDIEISPAEGDIAAALATACEGKLVKNITINLTKDATYTVSATLIAPYSITINGNGAIIDASALEGNMIQWINIDEAQTWTNADVAITAVTVKGLKKALFYSNSKYYYGNFTLINSFIEQAADATTFDYTKGSVALNFTIAGSTIYAPTATTKSLYSSQSGQKAIEYNADATQNFVISVNTMYNLAPGKNFFTHRQNSQKWLSYTVQNNLFVNCGKSGQVIKGLNGGSSSVNPTWTIKGNAFNFDGADTSANEETGDADHTQDETPGLNETVQDNVAGVMTFTNVETPDFGGTFEMPFGATAPEALGDNRWTITFTNAPEKFAITKTATENGSFVVKAGETEVTEAAEGTEITIIATPAEGYELEAITVKDADGADVTVTDGKFTMPAKAVTVSATFKDKRIVYDFAAEQALIAAGTVEKPGHLNGNQNNGQGFNAYGVKIRNDYKGYVKKEGSTLPETCNIWRRSDRFDQDASWNVAGGVNMPNDREFAIDGLTPGSKVVIEYDATNASEGSKNIIWAVGENNKLGEAVGAGEGIPVTTATIGGVEAVPNETAIASGAEILIKSVTPAVKGTGYMVIKVKKNTIISKISILVNEDAVSNAVTVADGIENGTVKVNRTTAYEGDDVYVTATPAEGYELEAITVKDADGADVTVTDGKFTMPAKAVTVSATFAEVPKFTITVGTVTNGTVEIASSAAAGEKVYITLTPDEGYTIDNMPTFKNDESEDVTAQVEVGKDDNGFYLVMPAFNITASYAFSKLYNITLPTETTYGTVTIVKPEGTTKSVAGKNIKIKVTDLATGYKVVAKSGDTEITLNAGDQDEYDYYFEMPEGDVTISIELATGINSIAADKMKDATIFTIGGQRVDKAQKGLYIINGKKVVIK